MLHESLTRRRFSSSLQKVLLIEDSSIFSSLRRRKIRFIYWSMHQNWRAEDVSVGEQTKKMELFTTQVGTQLFLYFWVKYCNNNLTFLGGNTQKTLNLMMTLTSLTIWFNSLELDREPVCKTKKGEKKGYFWYYFLLLILFIWVQLTKLHLPSFLCNARKKFCFNNCIKARYVDLSCRYLHISAQMLKQKCFSSVSNYTFTHFWCVVTANVMAEWISSLSSNRTVPE